MGGLPPIKPTGCVFLPAGWWRAYQQELEAFWKGWGIHATTHPLERQREMDLGTGMSARPTRGRTTAAAMVEMIWADGEPHLVRRREA